MNDEAKLAVVLPLEPEEDNEDVYRLVRAVLRPEKTRLRRIYVWRPMWSDVFLPEGAYVVPEINRAELEAELAAGDLFLRAGAPFEDLGYTVESDLLKGSPTSEVLREIERSRADLAIVRVRRDKAEDARLGGMASALLHHATCPVLLHRDVAKDYAVRRVLIATDFSQASRNSAAWGLAFAETLGAEAHLLYVVTDRKGTGLAGKTRLVELATEEIARWRGGWDPRFPRPVTDAHVISAAHPAEGVLEFAEDLAFDLVVLGATGRSAAWAVLLGSTARTVIRRSRCPVLAIPASSRVPAEAFLSKVASVPAAR